jgi:hypothetical protein
MGLGLRVHPTSGIGDAQQDIPSFRQPEVHTQTLVRKVHVDRLEGQFPPLGHGVPGVHAQIHDHLLDLSRIRLDFSKLPVGADQHLDVLAQKPRQHFSHSREELIQVQHHGLDELFSAERQELSR